MELKGDKNHSQENQAAEIVHAVIHQESLEEETVDISSNSPNIIPYAPGEEDTLPYPIYPHDNLPGDESPPLDCNKSLITSEPRHTM